MKTLKRLMAILAASALLGLGTAALTPVLKYANAGTQKLWTEEGYYGSCVLCDLEGDGTQELVFSNYSITVLDAATGNLKFHVNSGHDRSEPFAEFGKSVGHTWCSPVVRDIDADGSPEIITVHGNGLVSVLDANGYFKSGFPQTPIAASARSLKAEDLDGDGFCEIIVGYGAETPQSVYVFNHDGNVRNGWPQLRENLHGIEGFAYGVFMDNIAVGDLDGDGKKEIVVPTDTEFVSVYREDGTPFEANTAVFGRKNWAHIGTYEDYAVEQRGDNGGFGWPIGNRVLDREELYKLSFSHAVSRIVDVDGDGKTEIVVPGLVYERNDTNLYDSSLFMTVCIFNTDRTRYQNAALDADWQVLPTDLGKPLVTHPEFLVSGVCQTPTVCDLDGDGMTEILFNSYNGRVECFSLNKVQPYAWPYSLTKRTSALYEYASPVVCRDLDGDGKYEVIFTSFYDEQQSFPSCVDGSLYIVNYEGKLLSKTPLPPAKEVGSFHNGAMGEPLVADIDGDGAPEIVVNTLHGGVCAFDLI